MGIENTNSGQQQVVPELPCIAKVVSHGDGTYMGRLKVELLRNVGNDNDKSPGQIIEVDYMSPFYGVTSVDFVDVNPDDYDNTQKSFGMWMIPPTPGSYVMVIFHNGKIERGYWIGCLPGIDAGSNFMTPGLAATKYNFDESEYERVPVAEYNKVANGTPKDPTKVDKPRHPFTDVLIDQGLIKDDARGITTSSARRETPSMVFGISTPGPVDKNGKQGEIGEAPNKVPNARVSFLGGTTFVMDDGDANYLRKTAAGDGPPEYVHDEGGEEGGDNTIPHNELVRIRTRTGHQILLHNSEDLIYIGNSKGTTWIEMTSNGKIDIFAEDSISIHSKNDLNIRADRDINLEAKRNVNIKAVEGKFHTESKLDTEVISGKDTKITTKGTSHISSGTEHREKAATINMNGPDATKAVALTTFENPAEDESTISSIMLRVPTAEPYPHHENLDPESFLPDKTDRDAGSAIAAPAAWKEYSTATDTFEQIIPPEDVPEEDL
jgi:hypothetical protein